ncbi:IPIL1 protein, partial [Rhinopomastus cyanomelas]|nr:IPIL1 protein [Rhinopomastus cyanomelas]
ELVDDLLSACKDASRKGFFPVLQPAIGIGSAFEGWCPSEDEVVFRMLVPLKPPRGHDFHLEVGTKGQTPDQDSHIRVELKCTCDGEQLEEDMLCFIHPTKTKTNQAPSLLLTLCTGAYLDVHKTVLWFKHSVMAWLEALPQICPYTVKMLPSQRSCMMEATTSCRTKILIEILFGVQQGDSDIFLISRSPQKDSTPSTVWLQSCAVAEAKFFKYVARNIQPGSLHLTCLCICCCIRKNTSISLYAVKTVVMHLLTLRGWSDWCEEDFLTRLADIMQCLTDSVEKKELYHFFTGNDNVPKEIILPPDFLETKPLNLFKCLEEDSATHTKALQELKEL